MQGEYDIYGDLYPAGRADLDRDRDVDGEDLAYFVAAFSAGNADLNGDSQTNESDLAEFAKMFGSFC